MFIGRLALQPLFFKVIYMLYYFFRHMSHFYMGYLWKRMKKKIEM